jgi:UDP-N-acetylglucosamine 1-carboxyvinyltransferase
MARFVIQGGRSLQGRIEVKGSKNAVLPILAATLLSKEPCIIKNVPLIEDVFRMIELLKGMGAEIRWLKPGILQVNTSSIKQPQINYDLVSRFRASILVLGPLLARFKKVSFCHPGGCIIGARPIDTHIDAFAQLGVKFSVERGRDRDLYFFDSSFVRPGRVVLKEFGVTPTENIVLLASCLPGKTQIEIAAAEPHVQDLCNFLRKCGVSIQGVGTHSLVITGRRDPGGTEHTLIPDPIEVGSFAVLGAATRSRLIIENVCFDHLDFVFKKFEEFNIHFKKDWQSRTLTILPSSRLKASRVQTLPYPGFPSDLQAPMTVLATQAEGSSLIHEVIYEGRLKHIEELQKMGANAMIADPHRALITGPTLLYGRELASLDIRSGATMVIAGLVAEGETIINQAEIIDRGYEKLEQRLQGLGARIKRIK